MYRKYEKLIFELPAECNELVTMGDETGFIMSPQAYFRGASQIPGSKFNIGYQIFFRPFVLDRIQHHHDVDEYLIFLGATFPNLFDFDAEIELTLGKSDVDAEVVRINKPSIIRVPAGVEHCPIVFTRVNKPVFFQAALMQDMFSSIYDTEDGGRKELWYNGPLSCTQNPDKKCDSCRNCIEKEWR